jgi:hypothetical protein
MPMQFLLWKKTCHEVDKVVVKGEVDEVVAVAKVMGEGEADQLPIRKQ